jgi:endonuclease YncB( thermonuclease family)
MENSMRHIPLIPWVVVVASSALTADPDDKQAKPLNVAANAVQQRADGSLLKDIIPGGISHSPEDSLRITGRPKVIDGNTIAFEDGREIDISAGMDAPPLGQKGLLRGSFYACGKQAAEFLAKLIGDRTATCFVNTKFGLKGGRDNRMHGVCYVGEERLDEAMILNGWAVADHSSTMGAEFIAREHKRGLWRGQFIAPKRWRKGERIPGEPESGKPPSPHDGAKAPEPSAAKPERAVEKPSVVREEVEGEFRYPGSKALKITGKVRVLDAHTLRFEDGTEVELNGGMDAPDLAQKALIGESFYSCGKDAAEFLKSLIGDQKVTCHVEGRRGERVHGACFVGETCLEIELVRNGWAISHHTGMEGWEMIARENKRGLFRGKFVAPERWRKGKRLPGEPAETESEREPLAALQRFEPIVTVDETKPGKPVIAIQFRANMINKVTDDDLVHLTSFHNLRSVDVPSTLMVTDAGLEHLAGLTQLEVLSVNWTKVTAAGVVGLVKGRRMMQRLELGGVSFDDDDLANLKDLPELRTLSLRKSGVTDKGLEHLKPFGKLRVLSLMSTRVGDAGLEHLKSLTTLEDLDLDRTAITDVGLKHLRALPNLRRLQMAHTAVTDAGLEQLQALSNLRTLSLRGTNATKEAADKLKQRIPQLQVGLGPEPN